ncbi:uncharacterized protein TNCV_4636931 [Trichonephila clavipes]|nr:uncharacterized protein TNCV_4636931 [Trichonephila clavipes]
MSSTPAPLKIRRQTKQLPHVAKVDLTQIIAPRRWGYNLGQSLSNHGPHIFYRRKIWRASRLEKQFNLVIDEELLDNACHVWSRLEIWLWQSPEGKEGQLSPTPQRCSAACLKYRQCVLEERESDIQSAPYHNTRCRTSVVVHNAAVQHPLSTVSPDSNLTIVMLQTDA